MFYVSDILKTAPEVFETPAREKIYHTLEALGVKFERVETDPGVTMEDCRNIDKVFGGRIVKTIFLRNRQGTRFYMYVTMDDKPFVTKDFCSALGVPRVSFASEEDLMGIAGVERGAATVLCACLPSTKGVRFVFDKETVRTEWFRCTDGTATCFLKLGTSDLMDVFMAACGREVTVI